VKAQVIDPRRDFSGLRIAAGELLDEGYRSPDFKRLVTQARGEAMVGVIEKLMPVRTVAEGYYVWIGYLCWLRLVMTLPGLKLELNADEVEGLLVLQEAQRQFDNNHKRCYHCGVQNEKSAGTCRECMTELK
jgi:ribosomal protein L40E